MYIIYHLTAGYPGFIIELYRDYKPCFDYAPSECEWLVPGTFEQEC
jgi:hypothetical protein